MLLYRLDPIPLRFRVRQVQHLHQTNEDIAVVIWHCTHQHVVDVVEMDLEPNAQNDDEI